MNKNPVLAGAAEVVFWSFTFFIAIKLGEILAYALH